MDSSFLHGAADQVNLESSLGSGAIFANVGNTTTFSVTNNKADTDIWMNIRK